LIHLTDFLRLLARHDPRRGLADHKWVVTLPSGPKKPGFAGPNPPIGVVAALARYSGIALRTASSRMNGFGTIKRVKDYFLWYNMFPMLVQTRQVEPLFRGQN